jgi:hypothetical protein
MTQGGTVESERCEEWVAETNEGYDQPLNTRGGKVFPLTVGTVFRLAIFWWLVSGKISG